MITGVCQRTTVNGAPNAKSWKHLSNIINTVVLNYNPEYKPNTCIDIDK